MDGMEEIGHMDIEGAPNKDSDVSRSADAAATEWEKANKLFGNPNTCGNIIGNTIFNLRARHPLIAPFYGPNMWVQSGCSEKEVTMRRDFKILSFFLSMGIGIFIFSSLGAIEFYKALDCACGCDPFEWPPTQAAILADERYSESYWPAGTKMCYPIKGESLDNSGEGTQKGKLGPMYQKPVPSQYCDEADCSGPKKDELYTWSVTVDVINGVVFGASDHHCEDDECYYVKQEVFDKHLCKPRLVRSRSEYWTTLIVSELTQTAVSMLLLFLSKNTGKFFCCYKVICCCGCVGPVFFILVIAALANSIFGRYLFFPFFVSKAFVWTVILAVSPVISFPMYIVHKREFRAMFPGCTDVDDVRRKGVEETGATPPGGLLAAAAGFVMFLYNVMTKII